MTTNTAQGPSSAWCLICRQRGYASAHCAAVAAAANAAHAAATTPQETRNA